MSVPRDKHIPWWQATATTESTTRERNTEGVRRILLPKTKQKNKKRKQVHRSKKKKEEGLRHDVLEKASSAFTTTS